MTFTTNETSNQALQTFQGFDADTQLAILWFGYLDIKDQLNPGNANSAAVEATALYDTIKAMPQEQQLQAQRDIVSGANSDISRAYKAVSSSSMLDLWLKLAQGMETGEIITPPSDYQLPAETNDFVAQIKQLDFEERINFTRSAVIEMGAK